MSSVPAGSYGEQAKNERDGFAYEEILTECGDFCSVLERFRWYEMKSMR